MNNVIEYLLKAGMYSSCAYMDFLEVLINRRHGAYYNDKAGLSTAFVILILKTINSFCSCSG